MSDLEKIENLGGNTDNPQIQVKKQVNQSLYYCFTFNNYTEEDIEKIETILKHESDWYLFQEEKGDNGTIHLQGTLKLKKKQRITELKKWNPKIHWESTKSISASLSYCQKKSSRYGRVFSKGVEIEEEIEIEEPYGWQLEIIDILKNKPDKRKIYWYWEPNGNMGKTTLCKYLVVKEGALILSGKSTDMFHALSKSKNKKLIIIDCPRSMTDYLNYGAIEQIKNGLVFSGKYEGCQLVFNTPHIIIFSNEEPDTSKMSNDRWVIKKIVSP